MPKKSPKKKGKGKDRAKQSAAAPSTAFNKDYLFVPQGRACRISPSTPDTIKGFFTAAIDTCWVLVIYNADKSKISMVYIDNSLTSIDVQAEVDWVGRQGLTGQMFYTSHATSTEEPEHTILKDLEDLNLSFNEIHLENAGFCVDRAGHMTLYMKHVPGGSQRLQYHIIQNNQARRVEDPDLTAYCPREQRLRTAYFEFNSYSASHLPQTQGLLRDVLFYDGADWTEMTDVETRIFEEAVHLYRLVRYVTYDSSDSETELAEHALYEALKTSSVRMSSTSEHDEELDEGLLGVINLNSQVLVDVTKELNRWGYQPSVSTSHASIEESKVSPEEHTAQARADKLKDKGNEFFRKQKFTQALARYNEAIRVLPNFPAAWLNKGKCHMELNNLDGAQRAFETALEHKPDYIKAYFLLAQVHIAREDHSTALATLETGLSFETQNEQLLQLQSDVERLMDNRSSASPHTPAPTGMGAGDTTHSVVEQLVGAWQEQQEHAKPPAATHGDDEVWENGHLVLTFGDDSSSEQSRARRQAAAGYKPVPPGKETSLSQQSVLRGSEPGRDVADPSFHP